MKKLSRCLLMKVVGLAMIAQVVVAESTLNTASTQESVVVSAAPRNDSLTELETSQIFKFGMENLSDEFVQWLSKYNVGLITNQTGRDQQGQRTVDVLLARGVPIKKLFAPEHGLSGVVAAAENVHDEVDVATGLSVTSLYSKGSGKRISHKHIKDIDIILFDIQDSGMRHYTYISTMLNALEAAAHDNKVLVVLDRPNPLAANMEGPLVEAALQSFISIAPIPVRHGMTIGELAVYFNMHVLKAPAQLYVVRMNGYDRSKDMTRTLNINLSPNIACGASCRGYSFLGLLGEVSPFDVGVGTPHAFQIIGLPAGNLVDSKWYALHLQLKELGIGSDLYTYTHKSKKAPYKGLFLTMDAIGSVPSFKALLTVLRFFKSEGIALTYSKDFDKAMGTHAVQKFLNGHVAQVELEEKINKELHAFFDKAKSSYLYASLPKVVELTL